MKDSDSYWVKIYLAGPIEEAKQIIRREAKEIGLCVTIEPTTYIYKGGEEEGYVVGLINYPRFPKDSSDIWFSAVSLATKLKKETYQDSCLVMDPKKTIWNSDRE